ncbi:MAG: 2TM domain-containing protein [Candidatus Lokiarchaeota archaeon]
MYNGFSEESLRKIAQQKVDFRYSVKIHIGIYIIVSIFLFIINLLFTPLILWLIYPLFGWLIGITIHFVAYILYARGVYPMAKRGVIFHLDSYIFTLLFLTIINLFTLPNFIWVFYPIIFWGIALIIHILIYFIYYSSSKIDGQGKFDSKKAKAVEKELEKMKKKYKS